MMKNPDAMKMVLKYLTKQNLNEHQKKWDKMAKSKSHGKNKHTKTSAKKPTTTLKPKVTTTTKKAKTKSPIIQITQIKRRNDDVKKTHKNKEKQVYILPYALNKNLVLKYSLFFVDTYK